MKTLRFLRVLKEDEDGAVTVDWVVLTAVIVGLGTAAASVINPGVEGVGGTISTTIITVITSFN